MDRRSGYTGSGRSRPEELAVAEILVNDGGTGAFLNGTAFKCLFHGPAPVQPRSDAAAVPALPGVLLLFHAAGLRFQVWELQFLPQPVHYVVDFEFDDKLNAAPFVAAFTFAAPAPRLVGLPQHITGLGLALS